MEIKTSEQTVLDALARQVKGGGIGLLAKAYTKAWGEINNVVKNAANPHFGSNYADLGAVLDTIRPVFAANGLALLQAPGEIEGDKIALMGMLIHESGESISFKMHVPIGKATAQAVGSALTYGRRYQGAAVGGIAQVDDDGNAASEPAKKAEKTEKPAKREEASPGLMEKIAATSTTAELEALKPEVKAAGVTEISEAYLAKKKTLKESGK